MKKNGNGDRMKQLAWQLVRLREEKNRIERKERKVADTLIKLMEKYHKNEIPVEKENKTVKKIQSLILEIDPLRLCRLMPMKQFCQVVKVQPQPVIRLLGLERVLKMAEKKEAKPYLRVEELKKSVRS
ncbi:MAG TPA: hypothetical protein PLB74_00550 [Candidatus Paceibacterota bacterium]|nr:hypothetical protein [Candidatus Paceibacterota bacterium]HOL53883.1 hypothetical protein [Candidatus Paceibacterota bacterium]HON21856.1 hypothetical protein [Candidatus Paceibacterota bacterium]HOV88543.1 hypothetical protein [Candidatus Paceibacterota bacterium]HRU33511.1 hypothetical protein [Candidatus Paceibacterota bacterium]